MPIVKIETKPWFMGVSERGLGRRSYEVLDAEGKVVENTLENVLLKAAAPMLYDLLEAIEKEDHPSLDAWAKKYHVTLRKASYWIKLRQAIEEAFKLEDRCAE